MLASAIHQNTQHAEEFTHDGGVQRLSDRAPVTNDEFVERSASYLVADTVGSVVSEYGELGTKIASLAALRWIPGYRSELALISLSRAYTRRCMDRGGRWTSGVHLLWWTRAKLIQEPIPELSPTDFRLQSGASLARQTELAQWRLIMLRLTFVSDIGSHAAVEQTESGVHHPVSHLSDLAERAAEATELPSVRKLTQWVRRHGVPALNDALPESAYRQISRALHDPW